MYSPKVYEKAGELLWKLVDTGDLYQDMESCYYIYELSVGNHVQTGVVACTSVDDYLDHVIKCHENTRPEKEADRIRHIEACHAQTGPIYLHIVRTPSFADCWILKSAATPIITSRERMECVTESGLSMKEMNRKDRKIIWKNGPYLCGRRSSQGRRRSKDCAKEKRKNPGYTGKESFNYFLSVLFPWDELHIVEYNRVVKDLGGKNLEEFLREVGKCFQVEKRGGCPVKPEKKGVFGLYVEKTWYRLTIKEEYKSSDPVKNLDVSILQDCLLAPVLGIQNPKEDSRIQFVGGIRGFRELEERADREGGAAFPCILPI